MPPKLWVKMTIMNIILLIVLVCVTGVTLYQTACFLAADITGVEQQAQLSFNTSLWNYAWMISLIVVITGAFLYSTVTRKILVPIRELSSAMEKMKFGTYPGDLKIHSQDEIGDLVQHFNRLNRRMQQQEESRHQMLRDLSHELRTPLSNLQGYLEALEKDVLKGDETIYRSLAEETDRVSKLLRQLDDAEAWKFSGEKTGFSVKMEEMKQVVSQVVQMFSFEFEKTGIDLGIEVESGEVRINREGIQQVLTNLLSNALDYYVGRKYVWITGQFEDGGYVLTVNGEGELIPREERERIFDRFYRVDKSRSEGRSGLGLSISKQIVDKHGGTISLETDEHLHIFRVWLPL
jgi:two-component system, OmpR family, sensor histidine kinase BaeS